jgi:hypothetical protein
VEECFTCQGALKRHFNSFAGALCTKYKVSSKYIANFFQVLYVFIHSDLTLNLALVTPQKLITSTLLQVIHMGPISPTGHFPHPLLQNQNFCKLEKKSKSTLIISKIKGLKHLPKQREKCGGLKGNIFNTLNMHFHFEC